MNPRRTAAIVLRQFCLLRGSFARVIQMFVWIVIDMVLWGFITRYLNSVSRASFNFVPVLLGAVLMWDFFARVMHGVTMAFFEDVWSRNFLNIFASPLTVSEYVTGMVLYGMFSAMVGLAAMLLLATTVFGLSFYSYGLALIPFLGVLFLFGIALGVLGCALVLRLGPAAEWFIWPIPSLISPFVGVFYPLATLPEWMQGISRVLPPSYVFEGMRRIVTGQGAGPLHFNLALGAGLALVYVAGACWVFTKTYQRAIRTGLIARYSAESVS